MGDSIREDMEAALAELKTDTPEVVEPAPAQEETSETVEAKAPAPAPDAEEPGKLAPVEPAKVETPAPAAPEKAPASWKATTREKWATLDPEVRAEIMRRETETSLALNQTAQQRRIADEFQRTIAPYMPHFQADGQQPLQAIQGMLQASAQLRNGAPAQKAAVIAQVIQQFGVDVGLLDQHLASHYSGQAAPMDPTSGVMQTIRAELTPIQQFMQRQAAREAAQEQATQHRLMSEITDFVSKAEFFEDVRQDVADLLDLAANRGIEMSLQEAYDKATMLHPQVSSVVAQRKAAQAATRQTEVARKAQQASASLPTLGAPSQGNDEVVGDDIRSALMASVRELSR